MSSNGEIKITLEEYGQHLASLRPPLTQEQVEAAARLFVAFGAQPADSNS